MSIGAGIAVVGIWLGVALIGQKDPGAAAFTTIFAMFATAAIAFCGGFSKK